MKTLASRLLAFAAGGVDAAMLATARFGARRTRRLPHAARLAVLDPMRRLYSDVDASRFFVPPDPIAPRLEFVRAMPDHVQVWDASWASRFEPFAESVRDKYLANEANHTAVARLFLASKPRPAVVLVHGYSAGQWRVEERVWPLRWLLRRGLDVALVVLPFHALRAKTDSGRFPPWPSRDPRITNEGFGQAVYDIRALLGWLGRRGAGPIGMMGMSLGGYTTALMATLQPDLAFAVPVIPLASLADFARDHGKLPPGAEGDEQHAMLEAIHRVVSPLARPSLLVPEQVLVIGARQDRITPVQHAERLASHFQVPLVRFDGAHLVHVGIGDAYRAVGRMLNDLGIVTDASSEERRGSNVE
ncbi:MAG: alpha/beta hydrolase family protein [Myxococcales bacterium]